MRSLLTATCTALIVTSCAPEKRGVVDVVVSMDGVRMDDTTHAMVAALSQQIRSGFEVGQARQASFSSPLELMGPGPEWAVYLGSVVGRRSGGGTFEKPIAVADLGSVGRRSQPFRFRAKGRSARAPLSALRDLMIPVVGITSGRLRDTYGDPRSGKRIHGAIDIHAPLGTPVVAAVSGSVWKIRSDPGGGRTVHLLDASGSYVFYYAHLSRYAAGLREGQAVERGDVLGYVGRSGDVVGSPHLHLRINRVPTDREHWWDTKPLNPYPLLKSASTIKP